MLSLVEHEKSLITSLMHRLISNTDDFLIANLLCFDSQSILLSSTGKMPTVVSPEVYRNRFSEMMGKYFLPVPDQWSGLGRDIDN